MNISKIPIKTDIIYKPDPRIESYKRDAVIGGDPDAVVRPRDWQEVTEVLKWCNGNLVPVTVCGARTSMTGSSVAENGVLLTTDHFDKILDIGMRDGKPFAIVEPGVIAKNFQTAVEEKGYHYPVVPTSCDNAFIGGTVSTNATGEDFYKYGPTRSFVREISYIKMDGTTETLKRSAVKQSAFCKGFGGYFMNGEEIDKIIGSEGTLVVITRIVLDLLPHIPKTFIILAPFSSNMDALAFINTANKKNYRPRSLEFIDSRALSIIKTNPNCPKLSDSVKALVYIKDEYENAPDKLIETWFERLPKSDETIIAITEKEKSKLHELRHFIPETISEINEKLQKVGGGKISADWWVPKEKMIEMMQKVYAESNATGIDFTAYGHLGDGHPHVSYMCKTPTERETVKKLIQEQCKRVVSYGGGVAAEHGIGKIKRDLLAIQYSQEIIEKMRALKQQFDPKWLLGRGNILTPSNP